MQTLLFFTRRMLGLAALVAFASTAEARGVRHRPSFDGVKNSLDAAGPRSPEAGGLPIGADTRLYTGLAVGGGQEGNIDQRFINQSDGAYGFVDAGGAIISGPASSQTTAIVRGSLQYHDIDFRPERWDAGILIDHLETLAPGLVLNTGGFFLHDDIDISKADTSSGYYELKNTQTDYEAFLRGRALRVHYLTAVGAVDTGAIFAADESESYNRFEQSAGILLMPQSRIAPFVEGGFAYNDYFHKLQQAAQAPPFPDPDDPTVLLFPDPPDAVINRQSSDGWAVAGLRIQITNTLRLDLGGRVNQRWLETSAHDDHTSGFIDAKLVWQPSEQLFVEFNIDRTLIEPYSADAYVTDLTSYTVYVSAQVDPRTRLTFDSGVLDADQIGSLDRFKEYYAGGKLAYALDQRTELFTEVYATHIINTATDEDGDRLRVAAGMKIGF